MQQKFTKCKINCHIKVNWKLKKQTNPTKKMPFLAKYRLFINSKAKKWRDKF